MTVAALILAAGKGTRMESTKPKVLHAIAGEPLLGHVLAALSEFDVSRKVVVVGFGAEQVSDYLKRFSGVETALQAEQRGTGHAVMMAREALAGFEGDLLILSGDVPLISPETLKGLIETHQKNGAALTLLSTHLAQPKGYGRILRSDDRFAGIVEEKDATDQQRAITEINAGVYIARWKDLSEALNGLTTNNAQGEYYLTDAVTALIPKGVSVFVAEDPVEIMGINSRVDLVKVAGLYRTRRAEHWLKRAVTVESPETTWIGPWVTIGNDSTIEQGVSLLGQTRIGKASKIGQHSYLDNAVIGDEVTIHISRITDSEVGDLTTVGPFAHLRNHACLGKKVRVGNFVELKNTTFADGAKASHLSYLGDSTLEGGVNIGAGTITCNYDGKRKHPTVIKQGAFVGSNSTLVAPVTIGEGAYVAAGSVITKNVPGDALALGRSRQVIKEQWAAKRKGTQA